MAEQFGEAEVVLRGRLDTLQRDLDQAEQMVAVQTERIAQSQQQAAQSIQQSGNATSGVGSAMDSLRTIIIAVIGPIRLLGGAIKTAGAFLAAIPILAGAAGVALVGLATGGVALVGVAIGGLAQKALDAEAAIERLIAAGRELDGSERNARAFADALRDIPIIGRLSAQVWQMFGTTFGATSEQQLAAWTSIVAKIEDGQVKVGTLGRAMNGLLNISTPGIIARLLGFDTNIVGQIDEMNAKMREMNDLMRVQASFAPVSRNLDRATSDARTQAENTAALAGLEGVDRVKEAERQRYAAAMQFFDDQRLANNQATAQIIANLQEEGATDAQIDEARKISRRQLAAIEMQRVATQKALNAAAREAVNIAKQEADEKRRARADQIRAEDAATVSQNLGLRAGATATRLRSEGREFEADRVQNEADRNARLAGVEATNTKLIALINEYYDARADEIDARERMEAQRQEERNRERLANQVEATKQLQSELQQVELQAAGDRVAAAQEAIRERYRRIIADLVEAGNEEAAAIARQIRDAKIEAAGRDDTVRRQQEAAQVSFSRTAIGGTNAETVLTRQLRIAEEQRELQRKIAKNTERTTARAG